MAKKKLVVVSSEDIVPLEDILSSEDDISDMPDLISVTNELAGVRFLEEQVVLRTNIYYGTTQSEHDEWCIRMREINDRWERFQDAMEQSIMRVPWNPNQIGHTNEVLSFYHRYPKLINF